MLLPLLQRFPAQMRVSLYHTPDLRGLLRLLVPERFNETIGVQHIKAYLFDNSLIISGCVHLYMSQQKWIQHMFIHICYGWKPTFLSAIAIAFHGSRFVFRAYGAHANSLWSVEEVNICSLECDMISSHTGPIWATPTSPIVRIVMYFWRTARKWLISLLNSWEPWAMCHCSSNLTTVCTWWREWCIPTKASGFWREGPV